MQVNLIQTLIFISALLFQNLSMARPATLLEWKIQAKKHMISFNWSALNPMIEELKIFEDEHPKEVTALRNLCRAQLMKRSNPEETIELAQQTLDYYSNQNHEPEFLVFAWLVMGNAHSYLGHQIKANYQYLQAKQYIDAEYSRIHNYEKLQLIIQYNQGFARIRQGNMAQASLLFWNALNKAYALKDTLFIGNIYSQLGNIQIQKKNFQEAILLNRKGLLYLDNINAKSKVYLESALGTCYSELGKLDSAAYYLEKAVYFQEQGKNTLSLGIALTNLAEVYRKLNKIDQAISLNQRILELGQSSGLNLLIHNGSINLCLCNLDRGAYREAIHETNRVLEPFPTPTNFNLVRDLNFCLAESYAALDNHKQAMKYFKIYKAYSDSIINQASIEIYANLENQYQLKTKETQIIELEKDAKIKSLLQRQLFMMSIAIISIIVLISSIIYLLTRRRLLKAEKSKLVMEQKLLRFQMNPHFIFNAISSIQNYLFDRSDLRTGLKYISNFAELMRQTLEYSREPYISLDQEISALKNYLSLQQLRFQNSFQFEIIIDDELDVQNIGIPPLIAQPFVENSIEHGLIYKVKNGKVKIRFASIQKGLSIKIEDNGVGLHSKRIERMQYFKKKKSLATKITMERLETFSKANKQKFQLMVEKMNSGGTLVSIEIPIAS